MKIDPLDGGTIEISFTEFNTFCTFLLQNYHRMLVDLHLNESFGKMTDQFIEATLTAWQEHTTLESGDKK
ncbi:hypothetical protein [Candidatus Magnetobacterium casense]|uniref:Uncharacterized protein n=1 Tax=Candidatus Magnetobacterium casense TaxID=1455061 RepID=A0ABS6RXA3_9BACT|nr:hypothetical protein [Candidatus Magnetobacterium casensis]MBV6341062.1 hypothetical protein [Candidatus Magnetobacterium casensis]